MPARDYVGNSCIVHKLLLEQRPALDLQSYKSDVTANLQPTICRVQVFGLKCCTCSLDSVRMTPGKPVSKQTHAGISRSAVQKIEAGGHLE